MRLSILYLTTCVGLQYGSLLLMLRSFSWKRGINHFLILKKSIVIRSRLKVFRIYLKYKSTALNRDNHRPADLAFSVTPSQ